MDHRAETLTVAAIMHQSPAPSFLTIYARAHIRIHTTRNAAIRKVRIMASNFGPLS